MWTMRTEQVIFLYPLLRVRICNSVAKSSIQKPFRRWIPISVSKPLCDIVCFCFYSNHPEREYCAHRLKFVLHVSGQWIFIRLQSASQKKISVDYHKTRWEPITDRKNMAFTILYVADSTVVQARMSLFESNKTQELEFYPSFPGFKFEVLLNISWIQGISPMCTDSCSPAKIQK